jgi:hypothetical protein
VSLKFASGTGNPGSYGAVAFGTGSQYLTVADNVALQFGTGNFTIEFWIKPDAVSSTYYLNVKNAASDGFSMTLGGGTAGRPNFISSGGSVFIDGTQTLVAGVWTHLAFVRAGTGTNQCTWYTNGVATGTGTAASNLTSTAPFYIGAGSAGGSPYFKGYMSNYRAVKGVAVYTGNFTVPTAPLTATQSAGTNISAITGAQTSLLLNTPSNASFLTDSSTYAFTVTNSSTPTTQSTQTPFVQYGWTISRGWTVSS